MECIFLYKTLHMNNSSKINHNFFENIDSEAKAYLLGFLAADGNVSHNTNKITLHIGEKDVYVANLLKEFITRKCTRQLIN